MQKFLFKFILILTYLSAAVPAWGQRVNTNSTTRMQQVRITMDVYGFDYVDRQPQFPGGDNEMIRFINNERRYPEDAYKGGIEGRVLCSFVVNEDGTLSHISVLRGVEESLNREAVRIISRMPPWVAGEINDTPVPVYCILPIPFRR